MQPAERSTGLARQALVLCGALALLSCRSSREIGPVSDASATPSSTAAASTAAATSAAEPMPTQAPRTSPAAPQPPPPERRRYRVLALGDSLTDQGVGGGGYLRELGRACPLSRFDHFGRGGDMVNQMRRRFEQARPQTLAGYDTLIVYGGVNDLYSDL